MIPSVKIKARAVFWVKYLNLARYGASLASMLFFLDTTLANFFVTSDISAVRKLLDGRVLYGKCSRLLGGCLAVI